ncbi:AI-2E family transporter [Flavobacterium sp. N3904]|uniref:AI-2E family transporter n=1 Tax=Flavobacterium sp. N3904 TaxID=2986835 RepID=UPI0022258E7B|nr:AI-2E family transporter [Flavobacterium sp. N3904]
MKNTIQFPFYIRLAFTLLSLIALVAILYIGQDIIVPLVFALLFAILLGPVVIFFKRKLHFPNILAIVFALTLSVCIVIGTLLFVSWQISDILNDWNTIKTNVFIYFESIQDFMSQYFHLSKDDQAKFINNAKQNSTEQGKTIIASTLVSLSDVMVNLTLIPIYTFLILLYKNHFLKFLSKLYDQKYYPKLKDILFQIKVSVQSYILGLIFEMIAVSILTAIGFWFLGIKYTLVLGIITGILNLVPYLGILFAGLLSIIATLTGSADISIIIGVIVVNIIVQLIDNNILVPLIISSKVEINAIVSIVGIIIGGAICGISGMFLAIPIIAIFKVIFDRIDYLEPWGYLMGDNLPKTYTWNNIKLPLLDTDDIIEK